MPHDHLSPSGHPYREDNDHPLTYWQRMEIDVRELLVEKSVLTPAQINAQIEAMDARSPANGAAVVARAWVDPAFKARLLQDAAAASREMGFDLGPLHLIAVENTKEIHNLIVCTLCSCYPRNLLGLPPDWYKTRAYRSRAVREPRAVLEEFGISISNKTKICVHDSTADMRYIVLPARPEGTEGLSEADLAALVTRDSMIGTGLPKHP
ncbi:MAG TPA: nitrile hydratase subunit alpha [Roseovarius sp.]|nr:nitrile hydratase subunit alpha [Roseovarius sp.]